ncbi:3'-5' exonuclease domain containing protein [Plasmodium gonderi]|uniref:3'-5' exonuclease domain containing protein n=1 Tax=Plasmodium gonderi TaxID=77519 RepID=A0A1Y1JLE7_PLAGO|nr:3'-5' exonuclease domain containing protein [Plasmodium gonderi]GAW81632.1 3'-5' exonuclease domain containing protein [Plasmodium gonderi]
MQKCRIKSKGNMQSVFCMVRCCKGISLDHPFVRRKSIHEFNRLENLRFKYCEYKCIAYWGHNTNEGIENEKKNNLKNKVVENSAMVKNLGVFSNRQGYYMTRQQSRYYYSTNNKVHVKGEIYDIIPRLCKNKDVKPIASNLIFHILKFMNVKNVESTVAHKDNIKNIYIGLIRCYHSIFKNKNENGEYIFCIFNDELIKNISPTLRRNKKMIIQEIMLNSLFFFFKNNIRQRDNLDLNLLCEIIKYKKFMYILDSISFDKKKIKENLNVEFVDYLFDHFLNDKVLFSHAIELASLFLCDERISFTSPFTENSSYNCRILLKYILQTQSKNFLFLFLDCLKCNDLKRDVFRFLVSLDEMSGFFSDYCGHLAMMEYLLQNKKRDKSKTKGTKLRECTINQGKEDNNGVNYVKGEMIFYEDYYELPEEMKNISIITNVDNLKQMIREVKTSQEKHWVENIYNDNSIYAFELCDDMLTGEDININLRKKKKIYYIGIDVEWNRNKKASIISIATMEKIYLIDLINMDYNYKFLIHSFFKWILENPFIHKIFYNFACDMHILNLFFQDISIISAYANVMDLKDPIYVHKQRECISNSSKSSKSSNNIVAIELFNRNIIETNDVESFKKMTKSTFYDFNSGMKNYNSNYSEGVISVCLNHTTDKLYFKSLNDLCYKFLNKKLNKQLQLSNWSKRPLTKGQVVYAGIDSYALIMIEQRLIESNFFSTCVSNSNNLIVTFTQKYKCRNCLWD